MTTRKMSRSVSVATSRRRSKKVAAAKKVIPFTPAAGRRLMPPGSLYSVHPGVVMMQKWISELKAKTGCSLDEWIKHILVMGPKDERECREWLKEKHKLGTNAAWWLAEKALGNPQGMSDDTPASYLAACPGYVDGMYAGARSALRPIHDALVKLARSIGDDVKICPCQSIVPLYRNHVFAEIKPATNKRIDLGLALGDEPFTSRLLDTGGREKKARLTHKVMIASLDDVDLQVKRWLKQAYERDR